MGGYLNLEGGELGWSISWRQRLLKRTSVVNYPIPNSV